MRWLILSATGTAATLASHGGPTPEPGTAAAAQCRRWRNFVPRRRNEVGTVPPRRFRGTCNHRHVGEAECVSASALRLGRPTAATEAECGVTQPEADHLLGAGVRLHRTVPPPGRYMYLIPGDDMAGREILANTTSKFEKMSLFSSVILPNVDISVVSIWQLDVKCLQNMHL